MPSHLAVRRYRNRGAIRRLRRLIYDLVGPVEIWPAQVVRRWSRLHLRNQDRFVVTVFLLVNGVSPDIIRTYYRMAYLFDDSAWRQVEHIIRNYPESNWQGFNIHFGRFI